MRPRRNALTSSIGRTLTSTTTFEPYVWRSVVPVFDISASAQSRSASDGRLASRRHDQSRTINSTTTTRAFMRDSSWSRNQNSPGCSRRGYDHDCLCARVVAVCSVWHPYELPSAQGSQCSHQWRETTAVRDMRQTCEPTATRARTRRDSYTAGSV